MLADMLFNSPQYLIFLIAVVALYWRLPAGWRVPLLLLGSYVFYMSWAPPHGLMYGPLILLDSLLVYAIALAMQRWPGQRKAWLALGVTLTLGLLVYFKYANFFAETAQAVLIALNVPVAADAVGARFDIFLPLAISFTTFVLISYLVDVYRGQEQAERSFVRFAAYVAFFPHLIAGPIVRAGELLRQFDTAPRFQVEQFAQGIHRFCTGFFLKVFVADLIAVYVDTVFGNPDLQGFNTSWVAVYAFSIQLFCDFFGYTLMAQGSALLMGYVLPDNFNAPYFAKNMSDFWRRWHISLSRWLKDYLYIPLGGNRQGRFNTYRNLFITMGLGGLWHGASWNFVLWGLLNAVFLCVYKTGQALKINAFIPTLAAIVITFHAVCLTRVFFRAATFEDAMHMLSAMVNPTHMVTLGEQAGSVEQGITHMSTETALLIVLVFLSAHAAIRYIQPRLSQPVFREAIMTAAYCVFFYCLFTLGGTSSQQFIYFQF